MCAICYRVPRTHRIRIWFLASERVPYRTFVESALCDSIHGGRYYSCYLQSACTLFVTSLFFNDLKRLSVQLRNRTAGSGSTDLSQSFCSVNVCFCKLSVEAADKLFT